MDSSFKLSNLIAAVLAIVGFIVLLATPALVKTDNDIVTSVSTISFFATMFGGNETIKIENYTCKGFELNGAVLPIVSFILIIVAIVVLLAITILPLLNIDALDGFSEKIEIGAAGLLILAGFLMFFIIPAVNGSNVYQYNGSITMDDLLNGYSLGAGYIISAIIMFFSAGIILSPRILEIVNR